MKLAPAACGAAGIAVAVPERPPVRHQALARGAHSKTSLALWPAGSMRALSRSLLAPATVALSPTLTFGVPAVQVVNPTLWATTVPPSSA
jgi:hypothetical protein